MRYLTRHAGRPFAIDLGRAWPTTISRLLAKAATEARSAGVVKANGYGLA